MTSFSSLKYSDFSWSTLAIYGTDGAAKTNEALRSITLIAPSGSAYVFSVNGSPPVIVLAGGGLVYDLLANDVSSGIIKVQYSTYTISGPHAFGM